MKKLSFAKWDNNYQSWVWKVKQAAIKKFPSLEQDIIQRGEVCEDGKIYLGNLHYLTGFERWADSKHYCN